MERLLERTQPDWVIHCAALANLDACEADPLLAKQLNTELPHTLASHVARSGARLLHVSTDAVFDGLRGDYTEEDVPSPVGVYSRTKYGGELAVAASRSQRHHCPGQSFRLVAHRQTAAWLSFSLTT